MLLEYEICMHVYYYDIDMAERILLHYADKHRKMRKSIHAIRYMIVYVTIIWGMHACVLL